MPRFFLLIMRLTEKKNKKEKEIPFYNDASVEWLASVFLKCPNEQFLLAILYDHTVVAF